MYSSNDQYQSIFNDGEYGELKCASKFYAFRLFRIEAFVKELVTTDEMPFLPSFSRNALTEYNSSRLSGSYFVAIPEFILVVNMLSARFEYSEWIKVFKNHCEQLSIVNADLEWRNIYTDSKKIDNLRGGVPAAELFNALVQSIRNEWKTNNIQIRINARTTEASKRYFNYCRYVEALKRRNKVLKVLSIKLYYQQAVAYTVNSA